jgi:hypothetical protein
MRTAKKIDRTTTEVDILCDNCGFTDGPPVKVEHRVSNEYYQKQDIEKEHREIEDELLNKHGWGFAGQEGKFFCKKCLRLAAEAAILGYEQSKTSLFRLACAKKEREEAEAREAAKNDTHIPIPF